MMFTRDQATFLGFCIIVVCTLAIIAFIGAMTFAVMGV